MIKKQIIKIISAVLIIAFSLNEISFAAGVDFSHLRPISAAITDAGRTRYRAAKPPPLPLIKALQPEKQRSPLLPIGFSSKYKQFNNTSYSAEAISRCYFVHICEINLKIIGLTVKRKALQDEIGRLSEVNHVRLRQLNDDLEKTLQELKDTARHLEDIVQSMPEPIYPSGLVIKDGLRKDILAELVRAVELLREKNDTAANACLVAVMNRFADEMISISKYRYASAKDKKVFWFDEVADEYRLIRGQRITYRLTPEIKVPLRINLQKGYKLQYEAFRSVDDQIDNQLNERKLLKEYIDRLNNIADNVKGASVEQIGNFRKDIDEMRERLERAIVEEKEIAKVALEVVDGQLLLMQLFTEPENQRRVNTVIAVAKRLLDTRIASLANMIKRTEDGRLEQLRKDTELRNNEIMGRMDRIIVLLEAIETLEIGDFKSATEKINRIILQSRMEIKTLETRKRDKTTSQRKTQICKEIILLNRAIAATEQGQIEVAKEHLWSLALGKLWGFIDNMRVQRYLREPELRQIRGLQFTLKDIIAAHDLQNGLQKARLIRDKGKTAQQLGEFISKYRDLFVDSNIGGVAGLAMREAFDSIFADYIRKAQLVRGSPAHQARIAKARLFWTRAYQAAFIPLNIDNLQKKTERIPNPAFQAISGFLREILPDATEQARTLLIDRIYREHKDKLGGVDKEVLYEACLVGEETQRNWPFFIQNIPQEKIQQPDEAEIAEAMRILPPYGKVFLYKPGTGNFLRVITVENAVANVGCYPMKVSDWPAPYNIVWFEYLGSGGIIPKGWMAKLKQAMGGEEQTPKPTPAPPPKPKEKTPREQFLEKFTGIRERLDACLRNNSAEGLDIKALLDDFNNEAYIAFIDKDSLELMHDAKGEFLKVAADVLKDDELKARILNSSLSIAINLKDIAYALVGYAQNPTSIEERKQNLHNAVLYIESLDLDVIPKACVLDLVNIAKLELTLITKIRDEELRVIVAIQHADRLAPYLRRHENDIKRALWRELREKVAAELETLKRRHKLIGANKVKRERFSPALLREIESYNFDLEELLRSTGVHLVVITSFEGVDTTKLFHPAAAQSQEATHTPPKTPAKIASTPTPRSTPAKTPIAPSADREKLAEPKIERPSAIEPAPAKVSETPAPASTPTRHKLIAHMKNVFSIHEETLQGKPCFTIYFDAPYRNAMEALRNLLSQLGATIDNFDRETGELKVSAATTGDRMKRFVEKFLHNTHGDNVTIPLEGTLPQTKGEVRAVFPNAPTQPSVNLSTKEIIAGFLARRQMAFTIADLKRELGLENSEDELRKILEKLCAEGRAVKLRSKRTNENVFLHPNAEPMSIRDKRLHLLLGQSALRPVATAKPVIIRKKRYYPTLAKVLEALTWRTRNGITNTQKALRKGHWRDDALYTAAKREGIGLPKEEPYPTALAVFEELAQRKSLRWPSSPSDLLDHPDKKYRDIALHTAAKRFGINLIEDRIFNLNGKYGGIGFNKKQLYLTTHLINRVKVKREENSIRLIDINEKENYLELQTTKNGLAIILPNLKDREAQKMNIDLAQHEKPFVNLSGNPLLIEFIIRLFWMKHPELSLTMAVMQELRALDAKYALDRRTIMWEDFSIRLPHLYEDCPGTVTVYRDSHRNSCLLALEETANPENFIIFLRTRNHIYILSDTPRTDITLVAREGVVNALRADAFKEFDVRIERPLYSSVKSGSSAASLGHASITFSSSNEFAITRRKGQSRRKEEWPRDTIVFRNVDTGEKITEVVRVGYYEFQIEGLAFPDGRPLVVKTNYINISTIVWSFKQFASRKLKDNFSPTEEAYYGGPSRIVRYILLGDKLIRQDMIPLQYSLIAQAA